MCCYVTFFSETGFPPHAACMFESGGGKQTWLSFGPREGSWTVGKVSYGSRKKYINHYVRFEVPCCKLGDIYRDVIPEWDGAHYLLGFQDCVSFASDVAEACGLSTNSIDMSPWGFVTSLAMANQYTNWNDPAPPKSKYPWE